MTQQSPKRVEDVLLAYQRSRQRIAADTGLSPLQVSLLRCAAKDGGQLQKKLQNEKRLRGPSVSRALARLRKKGLISSEIDENDARCHILRITKKGVVALTNWDAAVAAAGIRNEADVSLPAGSRATSRRPRRETIAPGQGSLIPELMKL
jgi:DNA-binding MarR family transcriptional regulator